MGVLKSDPGVRAWLLLAVGLIGCGAAVATEAPRQALESEVKAAFVVNFARYVEWAPGTPQADPRRPIRVAVLGKDPFRSAIDAAARGVSVQGRPVVVERVTDAGEATGANVVFIGGSEIRRAAGMLPLLNQGGALTVSDSPAVARHGAVITLVNESEHVRFSVNLAEARRARLTVSSQLLRLAKSIEGGP